MPSPVPVKPPHFSQDDDAACVAACLRMLFAYHGVEASEAELAEACETDTEGTLPSKAVEVARRYGFPASETRRVSFETLRELVGEGLMLIAYVDVLPRIPPVAHALVIYEVTGEDEIGTVRFMDPDKIKGGDHELPVAEFVRQWANANFRVIIVKR
jgi:ABC-type bacteriocin/lantibiotic exporter with double-glycine peptidase domain